MVTNMIGMKLGIGRTLVYIINMSPWNAKK